MSAWREAVESVRGRSPASFEQWFSLVELEHFGGGLLRLTAQNEWTRDWVRQHFAGELVRVLSRELGVEPSAVEVEWRLGEVTRPICQAPERRELRVRRASAPPPAPSVEPPPSSNDAPERTSRFPAAREESVAAAPASTRTPSVLPSLNPKYTFDNFIVGPSNELAYAAALSAVTEPRPRYNPLFICGDTGLGKTHLMHATAHALLARNPGARIAYVSCERFTNEYISAVQTRQMDAFRARWREVDVLLVDDVQFLAGKEQTQEEFFYTFNVLHESNRAIFMTSDKYPRELLGLPERLISRFTSGLVADIQVPQFETRVAIVRKKAELEGIEISPEIAVLLAESLKTNVRQLEGALIRLAARSALMRQPITLAFVRAELGPIIARTGEPESVGDIQQAVGKYFHVTLDTLIGKGRHKSIAQARQIAMFLARQRLGLSLPELGRAFGNRDHTTVLAAVRRVDVLRARDAKMQAHLDAIERQLVASNA